MFEKFWQRFRPLEIPDQAHKGFGFVDSVPTPEDFVLGGNEQALKVILSPERDYSDCLPVDELQSKYFTTSGVV
jgi:hypothetical protein